MYVPREREITIKQYGKYTRAIEAPKYKPNEQTSFGGKKKSNPDTPKARNNWGTSAHKALAIALNNKWQWYGCLRIAKEDIIAFDEVYSFIKKFIKRMQKQRERSVSKDLAYLIIPDYAEQDGIQKWFVHIWLQNVPNAEKAFFCDIISEKKIIYHWKKHEKNYGKSELYKIYNSGYTTNNRWQEQNAFQIFDIMARTSPFVPKEKNLYYSSNNVIVDIVIAKGRPSEINTIDTVPTGNGFVNSKWFTSLDLQKNITEAGKYLFASDLIEMQQREDEIWEEELMLEPEQEQEKNFFSYEDYGFENSYIPSAADYFFCDNAEYHETVEDFDYSALNDIYEKSLL